MRERYLITGYAGFVSSHFIDFLENNRIQADILGIDLFPAEFNNRKFKYINCAQRQIDLLDKENVESILFEFQPNYILHLASYSSVAFSWKNPDLSFRNNTNIFLNLLEAVRKLDIECRIISVGSSEEYGDVAEDRLPLMEDYILQPISPYAVARVAQEQLSKIYVNSFGLDIILTRSFNHIGPRQKPIFVVSSFAHQLLEIKKNSLSKILYTGDLSIVRDFVDVRDVVNAYFLLFKKGRKGEVYNICSGEGISLKEIVAKLASIIDINITTKTLGKLIRPSDNKIIIGSNKKINSHIGWANQIALEDSLKDFVSNLAS
jgi:GDP-4-dehydro-6-deoxy-D-mannose reductase